MATRIRTIKVIRYRRYVPKYDFLKHWRVVRLWAMRKYKLSFVELEILISLYSEGLFDQYAFNKVCVTHKWNFKLLEDLIERKFIHCFRKRQSNTRAQYELTRSSRKMIASIYKKLQGEEIISEQGQNNPIFDPKKDSYSNRQLQLAIKEVNKDVNPTLPK